MANHTLKSATMLSVFSSVMVVISTMTKIIEAIITQRQTQLDVLAGQDAIMQNHSRNKTNGVCLTSYITRVAASSRSHG